MVRQDADAIPDIDIGGTLSERRMKSPADQQHRPRLRRIGDLPRIPESLCRTDPCFPVPRQIEHPVWLQIKIPFSRGGVHRRNSNTPLDKKPHRRIVRPEHPAIHCKDKFLMPLSEPVLQMPDTPEELPAVILPVEPEVLLLRIDDNAKDGFIGPRGSKTGATRHQGAKRYQYR